MADQKGNLFLSGYTGLTHSDIANFTGKTLSAAEQTQVTSLIASIEDYISRQCRRNFVYATGGNDQSYFDTLDAGQDKYYLFNFPIKEVIKITVDDVIKYEKNGGSNTLVLGKDFFVYDNYVKFATIPYSTSDNRNALKIYYYIYQFWGEDIKLAVKQWVSDLILNREYAGKPLTSLNANGFSLNFDTDSIPSYIKSLIDQYKQVLI